MPAPVIVMKDVWGPRHGLPEPRSTGPRTARSNCTSATRLARWRWVARQPQDAALSGVHRLARITLPKSLSARSAFFRQASVPTRTWTASAILSNGLGATFQGLGMVRPVSRSPQGISSVLTITGRGGSSPLRWIRVTWIRSGSRRRCHEFRTDRIGDLLL
jgi:hypothetical protein